jgi:hypothetical protein
MAASSTSMTSVGTMPCDSDGQIHGSAIGATGETEGVLPDLVKPVGQELDAEPTLGLEVLQVGGRDLLGGDPCELVAVHEQRHASSMPQRPGSRRGGWQIFKIRVRDHGVDQRS